MVQSGERSGSWTDYLNNPFIDHTQVKGNAWPEDAKAITARTGIEPETEVVKY